MGPDPGRAPHVARLAEEPTPITRRTLADPTPVGFDRFGLRAELLQAVSDAGFTEPRPIQAGALPAALAGRDVLGLAQTGTGKTVAFALPILQRLLERPRAGHRALVVVPTRELAAQVHTEFVRLARHTRLRATAVYGGVPIFKHVRALDSRPEILVACPGRLLDLMSNHRLRLDRIEVLVLDEADQMFDMGFLPDLRRILAGLPRERQNLLFSATMAREIRELADDLLRAPEVVELSHSQPAETIAHSLYPLQEGEKLDALRTLLADERTRSAIVFLRTKQRAKRMARRLQDVGVAAVELHGNMSQSQRQKALAGFRAGRHEVLVATDIAARGLDIAGVSHVVNFDVPVTPEAYTHRIGRTGRAEQRGEAFTFATPAEGKAVRAIEKLLGAAIERRAATELGVQGFVERAPGRPAAATRGERPTRPERSERPRAASASAASDPSAARGTRPCAVNAASGRRAGSATRPLALGAPRAAPRRARRDRACPRPRPRAGRQRAPPAQGRAERRVDAARPGATSTARERRRQRRSEQRARAGGQVERAPAAASPWERRTARRAEDPAPQAARRDRAAFGAGLSYAGPTREERTSQGKPRRTRRRRV
ncbi:MAG: DEAD/DEAH box helicase [Planctomycetes bacterium]|nr:DEAD/DEAH box helicase [Planctomycetota bacterium]